MSIASIYLMTTIVRMFLLGTLVPLVSLDSTARDIFQSLVGVIDLFGIYYAINQTVGKPTIKVKFSKFNIFWKNFTSNGSSSKVFWTLQSSVQFVTNPSWIYRLIQHSK